MAERPSVCASCGKRLSKKSWYYRNGQFFCKKRCWETAKAKAQEAKPSEPSKTSEPAAAS